MRRLSLLVYLCVLSRFAGGCIEKFKACGCGNKEINGIKGKKLFCHNINITNLFAEAQFPKGPFLAMELTKNNAVLIKKATFGNKHVLLQVIRLDLSNNQINRILPRAFSVFPNLTHLNLSRNNIGRLSKDMFLGLQNLRMLDLSANFFPVIPGRAFESLLSLRKLFVESTDLVCNSLMLPFITWYNQTTQKIKLYGTCHLPEALKSTKLLYLKPSSINSLGNNSLSSLPHFEMSPAVPQLLFEGDEIEIICEGTDLSASKVVWSFNDVEVTGGHSSSFVINSTQHFHKTVIAGQLRIRNLKVSNSGTWKCTISSEHGSDARSLQVLVVKNDSVYCSEDSIENEKGSFQWKETIGGATTSRKCPIEASDKHTSQVLFATRECSFAGNWTVGEYTKCQYEDYVTRLTHNLLHENLHAQNILQRVRKLVDSFRNKIITNPHAVELIAELLQKVMMFIADTNDNGREDDLGTQILNLASFVMNTNVSILQEAQRTSGSCDVILTIVRSYALNSVVSSAFNKYSPNIAVSGNLLSSKLQYNDGMLCRVQTKNGLLKFLCDKQASDYEPFISLPPTLFDSVQDQTSGGYKLYFIAYRNGNLFHPRIPSSSLGSDNSTVGHFSSTMVLEAGVDGHPVVNLSTNAVFNFKNPDPKHHYAAWWSPTEGWLRDSHCYIASTMPSESSNYTKLFCDKITNVTLFYDPDRIVGTSDHGPAFEYFAHPAVFVGTGILLLCLIPVIFSYMCCYSKLKITSDARHMLINICVHLLLVSCAFTLGIWRVDYTAMCLTSGIVMHYSSLSVLLWITISARNIHREMIVYSRPPSVDPKPPRPMLRFYLVGCGIPAVICGITAAAKMQNYDGDNGKYCWLSWETSLFAFYLPAALIAIVCVFLLIRVLFAVNKQSNTHRTVVQQSHNEWRNRSDRYEGIYRDKYINEDTPLQYMNQPNGNRLPSEEIPRMHGHPENEQSHRIRLRGVSLLLFFFLATWVVAAISVAVHGRQKKIDYLKGQSVSSLLNYQNLHYHKLNSDVFQENKSHLSDVFSCVYAVLSTAMGIFLVVQHLICRRDIRSCWADICSGCHIARKGYERNADSQASTVPVGTDGNFSVNGSECRGPLPSTSTLYNDKTSSPKHKSNRQRENTVTTLSTDPVSTENPLHSTVLGAHGASTMQNGSYAMLTSGSVHNNRNGLEGTSLGASGSLGFAPMSSSSIFPPKSSVYLSNNLLHGYPLHHHHHHAVNSLNYTQQSHPSAHSAYLMRHPSVEGRHTHSPHLSGASPHHMGSSSRHIHPLYLCDSCPADSHRCPPEIKSYPHYGHYHHHLPHSTHAHPHGSGKPVRMTNLHMAHDSSMTEHSFDELAHNNMHTIPVVMQQHMQPKPDSNMLYYRYQKMMHKQGKRRKLTVLREYAQDPLTSNDEDDRRDKRSQERASADESSPLIQSPEKTTLGRSGGYANYTALDPVKDNLNIKNTGVSNEQPNGKLRMLLISSPSNRKRKVETSRKVTGESSDVRQHEVRGGRSSTGERNSASGGRRAKQGKFHHDNPVLSERERGTTSSERSEMWKDDGDGLVERIKKYEVNDQRSSPPSVCSGNFPSDGQLQTTRTTNSSLALDYTKGKDNHGYLTLQQLMSVNTFLPQNQPEESKEENTSPSDNILASSQDKGLPAPFHTEDMQQVHDNEELVESTSAKSLLWRNETSV